MTTATREPETVPEVEETPEPAPEVAAPEEPEETAPRGLYAKLAKIMGELSAIPSARMRHVEVTTRSGGSYSYDYITEATLMEELRPRLAREGIATLYSDTILRSPEPGSDDNLTVVRVTLTFVDGETGEKWNSHAEGYGTDLGDKGANKAKTSALRYLLWKTFLFASDVDPETESVERRSSSSRAASGGGARSGPAATDKQKAMVARLASEIDENGVTLNGRRPQDAIHVRTATEDMTKAQASAVIDLLSEIKKSARETEALVAEPDPLDAILGPPREGGGDLDSEADDETAVAAIADAPYS